MCAKKIISRFTWLSIKLDMLGLPVMNSSAPVAEDAADMLALIER